MKSITGMVVAAVVLGVAGGALVAAGWVDREMAHAEEHVAAQHYDEPEMVFARLEPYFKYASLVPGIGTGPLNDLRARRAAVDYWRGRYGSLASDQTDPVGAVPSDNAPLQLVVAHSVYRSGQSRATDRDSALKAIDAGIEGYLTILKNATHHELAAYNYEYLIRLRGEIEKNRRKGDLSTLKPEGALGRSGAVIEAGSPDQFKVLVPLDSGERSKAGAGKAAPLKRKG